MGTVVSFDLRRGGLPAADCAAALRHACRLLHDADATFSTWKPGSPMSRVRRGELAIEDAPPEVTRVLSSCEAARELSGGWFDPWAMPGGVDPTGLVKGWAAQRAAVALRRAGVEAAMVNAGGDIAAFGEPEAGRAWNIAIRDPLAPGRLWCSVPLEGALATSAHYERPGQVLDARSRQPAAGLLSASVAGPDLGVADALATGLLAAGPEGLGDVERAPGYSAYAILPGRLVRVTEGFPATTRLRR